MKYKLGSVIYTQIGNSGLYESEGHPILSKEELIEFGAVVV